QRRARAGARAVVAALFRSVPLLFRATPRADAAAGVHRLHQGIGRPGFAELAGSSQRRADSRGEEPWPGNARTSLSSRATLSLRRGTGPSSMKSRSRETYLPSDQIATYPPP